MKHLLLFLILGISLSASAQDYSSEKTTLANFLKRMYNQTKFEGVKIVEDYDNQYFISVLSLEKARYKTQSAMFRVANVKALRQASEYVNGGTITSDLVIRTTEVKDSSGTINVSEETIEKIHSVGFVQGMELLINFTPADTAKTVFIYSRKID
jgi:SLT domain-containing protein